MGVGTALAMPASMINPFIKAAGIVVLATAAAAGCGGEDADPGKLAGSSWTGWGKFVQVFGDKPTIVEIPLHVEFDDQGVARSLPSLGLVSPWRLYVTQGAAEPVASPAEPLAKGGSVWAYCPFEADGPANELKLEPGTPVSGDGATGWSYRVRYAFADLTEYSLYGYEGAPMASVQAKDVYRLTGSGRSERLIVKGLAIGEQMNPYKKIHIELDATLSPGDDIGDNLACRLGARPR